MPGGWTRTRTKNTKLQELCRKPCEPRPDQSCGFCGLTKCLTTTEKKIVRRSQGEVALLTWPQRACCPVPPRARGRKADPPGRRIERRCRPEKQRNICISLNEKQRDAVLTKCMKKELNNMKADIRTKSQLTWRVCGYSTLPENVFSFLFSSARRVERKTPKRPSELGRKRTAENTPTRGHVGQI